MGSGHAVRISYRRSCTLRFVVGATRGSLRAAPERFADQLFSGVAAAPTCLRARLDRGAVRHGGVGMTADVLRRRPPLPADLRARLDRGAARHGGVGMT